jgi:hypothetical protein
MSGKREGRHGRDGSSVSEPSAAMQVILARSADPPRSSFGCSRVKRPFHSEVLTGTWPDVFAKLRRVRSLRYSRRLGCPNCAGPYFRYCRGRKIRSRPLARNLQQYLSTACGKLFRDLGHCHKRFPSVWLLSSCWLCGSVPFRFLTRCHGMALNPGARVARQTAPSD